MVHAHCVTGMAARQPVFPPTAPAREMRDADQLAAKSGMAGDQQRLGFERHRVDDEPAARTQRRDRGVEHARFAGAAADEDGIRRGKARQRGRRRRPP